MNCINTPITDTETVARGYVFRDGFSFTHIRKPLSILNAIVIRNPSNCICEAPKVGVSTRPLAEHIAAINQYHLERAMVIAEDIHFLQYCPSLKMLDVIPAISSAPDFDCSPLYNMPNLESLRIDTHVGSPFEHKHTAIDYAFLRNLQDLCAIGKGHRNFQCLSSLKSLQLNSIPERDLSKIIGSTILDSLYLLQCGIRSLDGIENTESLRCLSLSHCRSLCGIGALEHAAPTITSLQIENCPKIQDFSCLEKLQNLEFLQLSGRNSLPSLEFLNELPNLKTFVFSMEVLDGDLTPCLRIPYVYSERNRRHYNLRDEDFSKNGFTFGIEGIDAWRCFH